MDWFAARVRSRSSLVLSVTLFVLSQSINLAAATSAGALDPDAPGVIREAQGIGQAAAEKLFSECDAAVYFPEARTIRWFDRSEAAVKATGATIIRQSEFAHRLELERPGFRSNAYGPYLLKLPALADGSLHPTPQPESALPEATMLAEGFENGLGNWQVDDNTLGLYGWGTTTCEAHGGARSADAVRGGVNTLGCDDVYAPNLTSSMLHASCEALAGAPQAWVDTWIHLATESGYDTLGFYYLDPVSDARWGYSFSGTWSAWFHIVLNLKQWYRVGDVTATTCPKLLVQFKSDVDTETGIGARIDDLSISTSAPSFLACSIQASVTTGLAPLTVAFTPVVSGSSSSTAYQWLFGDSESSSATTQSASFTYVTPGDYNVRLRVEDSGIRAYAHTTIHATSGSSCSLGCDATVPSSAETGRSVSFRSTATLSGCSTSPTYAWSFGDGQSSAAQNPAHAYQNPGTYPWSLTVHAGDQTCVRQGSISVSSAGRPRRRPARRGDDSSGTTTIGSAGGSVSGFGCTLTVPVGAFSSSSAIALRRSGLPRESADLSDTLYVDGLPDALGADLSIEVTLDTTPATPGSGSAIVVMFDGLVMNRDLEVAMRPFDLPATVSGRNVRATIPRSWANQTLANAKRGGSGPEVYAPGTLRTKVRVNQSIENDHFTMHAAPADAAWAQSALTTLEAAYQRLADLDFKWGCRATGTFRKVPVYVQSLGTGETDVYGEQVSRLDPCGTGYIFTDYIRLNKDFDVASPTMRASIGHELFHFLQEMYVPTSLTDPNRALWIAEASSTWFETVFVPGSCPGVMTGSYQFPWRGLFNPTGSAVEGSGRRKIQNHGYGVASLLKFHTDASPVTNDPFVVSIWNNLKAGHSELSAVQDAVGSSLPVFWTDFAKDFYAGKAGCSTYQQFSEKVPLTNAASLTRSFKVNAYPLSAISFGLDAKSISLTDKTPLPIKATGLVDGQSVFVYDVASKSAIAELTRSENSFTIPDITVYKGSVIVLTFVDANLPAGSVGTTNEVTLTTGGTAVAQYDFRIPHISSDRVYPVIGEFAGKDLATTWSGSSFNASGIETDVCGPCWEGQISLTGSVSSDRRTLTSAHITYHYKNVQSSGCIFEGWLDGTFDNVPAAEDWASNKYHFKAIGASAQGNIAAWSYRETSTDPCNTYGGSDRTFTPDPARADEILIDVTLPAIP